MSKYQSRSFSYDLKSSSSLANNEQSQPHSNTTNKKPSSLQKPQQKLPLLKIKQVMKKIGANDKFSQSFTPSDEEIGAFRKSKWKELKDQYTTRKGMKQPFDYELDEIVLDCWQYGENFGRRTIWRRYKQNFDQLTFDTLRVVHKKKI